MSKKKSSEKKEIPPAKREAAKPSRLVPYRPLELWRSFDSIFDNFRRGFQELLRPWTGPLIPSTWAIPTIETRIPYTDLEDRGKDFLLTAEMPGFKKEDIDIQVTENSIEIKAMTGWKYDDKTKTYICRERACESFHRKLELPDDIKPDKVEANLKDGVLHIILPKKAPKPTVRKKVTVK